MGETPFETEKFISQIKKHPAIYDVNCLQYVDRGAKTNAWFEVCRAMLEDWDNLSGEERVIEERYLRNKWRNIRDYFMKEVKALKRPKTGARGGRCRKKSVYHNQLLFLIPSVKKRGNNANNSRHQPCKDEVVMTEEIEVVETPSVEDYNSNGLSGETHDPTDRTYHTTLCEASMTGFDNEMPVDVLSTSQGNQRGFTADDDYDKMFLLSLLPSMRQIPDHMKLHVRIQIQQILASAFHSNNHHVG